MFYKRRSPREHGFTLVEVIVVLAILGLVYALALPVFSRTLDGPRLKQTARALTADLREARSLALSRGEPVYFYVDAAQGSWRFAGQSGQVDETIRIRADVPAAWRTAGRTDVIGFFPDGESSGGEIIVRLNDHAQRIQIRWLTGRVIQSEI